MKPLLALALFVLTASPAAADPCFCDVDPNLVEGQYTALRKGQVNYRLPSGGAGYASYTGDTKGNGTILVLWRGATQSCGESYSLPEVTVSFDGGVEQNCIAWEPRITSDSAWQCGIPDTLAEGHHAARVKCVAAPSTGPLATFTRDIDFRADSLLPMLSTAVPASVIVPVATFTIAGVASEDTGVVEVMLEGLGEPRISDTAANWRFDIVPTDFLTISTPATESRTFVLSAADIVGNGAAYSFDRGTYTVATSSSLILTYYMDGTPPSIEIIALHASTSGLHGQVRITDDMLLGSYSFSLANNETNRYWDGQAFGFSEAREFITILATSPVVVGSFDVSAQAIFPGDSFMLKIAALDSVGNVKVSTAVVSYAIPDSTILAGQSLFSGDCDEVVSGQQVSLAASVACQARAVTFIDRSLTTTYARGDKEIVCAQASNAIPFSKIGFSSKNQALKSISWIQGGSCSGKQSSGNYALTVTLESGEKCIDRDDLVATVVGQKTDSIAVSILVPTDFEAVKQPPFNRGVDPNQCRAIDKMTPCRYDVWWVFFDGPAGMNLTDQKGNGFPVLETVIAGPPIFRSCDPGTFKTRDGVLFFRDVYTFAEDKDGYEAPPIRSNCGDRSTQTFRIKGCVFPRPGQTHRKSMVLDRNLGPDGMANITTSRENTSP